MEFEVSIKLCLHSLQKYLCLQFFFPFRIMFLLLHLGQTNPSENLLLSMKSERMNLLVISLRFWDKVKISKGVKSSIIFIISSKAFIGKQFLSLQHVDCQHYNIAQNQVFTMECLTYFQRNVILWLVLCLMVQSIETQRKWIEWKL